MKLKTFKKIQLGREALRFLMAGGLATIFQYGALLLLVEAGHANEVLASAVGYTIGALVNYVANYYFTFASSSKHLPTMLKFFTIVALGLGLNTLTMYLGHAIMGIHYIASQVIATGLVFVWNFIGHKFWTYQAQRPSIRDL